MKLFDMVLAVIAIGIMLLITAAYSVVLVVGESLFYVYEKVKKE
jgi:hypothetical protein